MGSAWAFIALVAGLLASPINAVGATSQTDAYCEFASEFHDYLQDTFDAPSTDDGGPVREQLDDDEAALADATSSEFALEMVEVGPIAARAALRMLAEDGFVGTSEVVLQTIERSIVAECEFSLFEVELSDGRTLNVATGEPQPDLGRAIDQMEPAIRAVQAEVGADVLICFVTTEDHPSVNVLVMDGPTTREFAYLEGRLTEVETSIDAVGCATVEEVLAFDPAIYHDFLEEHQDVELFVMESFEGEPFYYAGVIPSGGGSLVSFLLDPQTGETIGTSPLEPIPTAPSATTEVDVADVTVPGSEASPQVVADCEALGPVLLPLADDAPDDPEVGEQLTDEYKDYLQSAIDDLEDVDLETDEVQAARDAFVEFSNEVLDADTWTEDLQTRTDEALAPLEICASPFTSTDEAADATTVGSEAPPAELGEITVGSANFPESELVAQIYGQALAAAGFDVSYELGIGSREAYLGAMESGEIGLIPEYTGSLLSFVVAPDQPTAANVDEQVDALGESLPDGLEVLTPSSAEDKDSIVCTQEVVDEFGLTDLSSLFENSDNITLGAPPEFETRSPFGLAGFSEIFDAEFAEFVPLAPGDIPAALSGGEIDCGNIFSTDPAIDTGGFVALEDDLVIVPNEAVLPLVRSEFVTPELTASLDEVNAALDTETLTSLLAQVVDDQLGADVVAEEFLSTLGSAPAEVAAAGCAEVDQPEAARYDGGAVAPTDTLEPTQTWTLTFDTSCGTFVVTLDLESAPNAAASLVALAQDGYYDDTVFHRIVPGFLIQAGDPTQTGGGGPGYETVDVPAADAAYIHGVVAMAKSGTEPAGTGGSQFFVVTGADVGLPPDYAIVGKVTEGLDVVDLIGTLGDPATEEPTQPVIIESVTAAST